MLDFHFFQGLFNLVTNIYNTVFKPPRLTVKHILKFLVKYRGHNRFNKSALPSH